MGPPYKGLGPLMITIHTHQTYYIRRHSFRKSEFIYKQNRDLCGCDVIWFEFLSNIFCCQTDLMGHKAYHIQDCTSYTRNYDKSLLCCKETVCQLYIEMLYDDGFCHITEILKQWKMLPVCLRGVKSFYRYKGN